MEPNKQQPLTLKIRGIEVVFPTSNLVEIGVRTLRFIDQNTNGRGPHVLDPGAVPIVLEDTRMPIVE